MNFSQQSSETHERLVGPDESFQARPFLSTRLTALGSPTMAVSSLILLISFFQGQLMYCTVCGIVS